MAVTLFNSKTDSYDTLYVGQVLRDREQNMYHDSYFYAVVWDEATKSIKEIEYGATAYYSRGGCKVDATPEVIAKAVQYRADRLFKVWVEDAANKVEEGTVVRSLTTRGKNKGVEGPVARITDSNYHDRDVYIIEGEDGTRHYLDSARTEKVDRTVPQETLTYLREKALNRSWSEFTR